MNKYLLKYWLSDLRTRNTILKFQIEDKQKDLSLNSVKKIEEILDYLLENIEAE